MGMEKEEIKILANKLMFDVSDKEAEDIANDFGMLEKMLSFFDEIDTSGVEEMIYPFDDETAYFREDEVTNVLSQKDALANVPKQISGHVIVPRVLK